MADCSAPVPGQRVTLTWSTKPENNCLPVSAAFHYIHFPFLQAPS